MHRGEGGCGGPIAFMRRKPTSDDLVESKDAIHINGSPIEFQSEGRCDTCGKSLTYGLSSPLEYVVPRECENPSKPD